MFWWKKKSNVSMTGSPAQKGYWGDFFDTLAKRTTEPSRQPAFVMNAILAVVIFGGLGIWTEVVRLFLLRDFTNISSLVTSVVTFFPAIACTASVQLAVSATEKGDKIIATFAVLMLSISALASIICQVFSEPYPFEMLWLALGFSAVAGWLWWIANGKDPTFTVKDPIDATGGSIDRVLNGDLGDIQV